MTGMSGARNQRYQQGARDDSTLVQQVLSSQMEKAEQWQYHELFKTKFVVKDRACRTIIDSESCNNLAFENNQGNEEEKKDEEEDEKEGNDNGAIAIQEPLCVEFQHVIHIASENEELKLLSSLNTWGHIQFDDLCPLNYLEKKLFARFELPCPSDVIFHIIGNYDSKEEYNVYRVYICLNLTIPPFHDEMYYLEDPMHLSNYLSSSSSCLNELQVGLQEGECCGFSTTKISGSNYMAIKKCFSPDVVIHKYKFNTLYDKVKPRTVSNQEGEDDEDTTSSDITMTTLCINQPKRYLLG
uniref:Retrotransposon protein, putative, Ty3-gypsy sub-class n=1 Tax=Oryza sativa subsp. japonica TaxID=39947 RepID=Q53NX1_ORYSJ|nr:retrotransposon protein, putative, Ty3-gypsy sub-class [Oryza sativa Japonica Group]